MPAIMWSRFKIFLTIPSVLTAPIYYANVEKFAAEQGWDMLLADAIGGKWPEILIVLESRAALAIAVFITAFTLGVWFDRLLEKVAKTNAPDFADLRISVNSLCMELSDALADERHLKLSEIQKTKALFARLRSIGLMCPDVDEFKGKTQVVLVSRYLNSIMPYLRNDLQKEARAESKRATQVNADILREFGETNKELLEAEKKRRRMWTGRPTD